MRVAFRGLAGLKPKVGTRTPKAGIKVGGVIASNE